MLLAGYRGYIGDIRTLQRRFFKLMCMCMCIAWYVKCVNAGEHDKTLIGNNVSGTMSQSFIKCNVIHTGLG